MDHLPLQVGEPHPIVVGEAERPHPGGREVQRHRRAESADPNDEHARAHQALLAGGTDLGQCQVSRVALPLLGSQRGSGHQLPFGPAGAE